ncbi:MAG: DUF4861 domain-containing protein [Clostridium sp.]|nr:DUF4861 domain-containing protein [Clostridium sp.]
MRRMAMMALGLIACCGAFGQTDAYIKLNDKAGKHPRIVSITYPGDADNLDMYNSIYGHGAVIENPWVAYRVYMDNRQSLDLYVKQKPQLELDATGFYTTPEQLAEGYGCDVLWAGKSIGAGSFRGWKDRELFTIDQVEERTQTVVSPSCVEAYDKAWQFNGHDINMTQTYSMSGDSDELTVKIKLEGYGPDDLFCTGIQKLELDNKGFINPKGFAASHGRNVPDKAQPEMVETVVLGIAVDPKNIVEAYEDDLNYLFVVRPDSEGVITYRVFASGSRAEAFKNDGGKSWFEYISSLAK